MTLTELCKTCLYYNAPFKTCSTSLVATSTGKFRQDYVKFVRLDKKRCGPKGTWYLEKPEFKPVEEMFDK